MQRLLLPVLFCGAMFAQNSDLGVLAGVGDRLDLVGWVTLDNQSGKQFDHARIKLMAGAVPAMPRLRRCWLHFVHVPRVEEKAFEDYHLYALPQPVTMRDRETKQVEFLRAAGIQSKRR